MTSARDQIIEATCELLELQGYHATGLNEIIKQSGSPKGSLYYYFPGGKEELTAEALNTVGRLVLNRIRENLFMVDDAAEAVKMFIMNVAVNVRLSGFRTGGPITTVALETAATNPRLREECQRIYAEWQGVFEERLQTAGIEQARAARLAALCISAIEGGIILCRTNHSTQPLEDVALEVCALIAQAR